MTISLPRALRPVPAALLAVLALSACSFSGSVSAATTSAHGTAGSTDTTSEDGTGTSTAGSPTTGSSSATSTSPGASTPAGTSTARTDRCHTGELAGSLTPGSPGAGQRYATLTLRNTGGRTCTVYGYGGLGLAGSDGHALPTHQVRSGGPATTVRLAPGGSVRSALHWGAIPGPGDSPNGNCQPTPTTLRVIPPDETDSLSVTWTFGPVCEGGTIEQHPYTS
jgi:hypothetical protein